MSGGAWEEGGGGEDCGKENSSMLRRTHQSQTERVSRAATL